MILNNILMGSYGSGYIGGTGSGILTVASKPASRDILVFDAKNLTLIKWTTSLVSGNYIITGLDVEREYLVIGRDYKGEYEPFGWDNVKPLSDLSASEQKDLWLSWQVI